MTEHDEGNKKEGKKWYQLNLRPFMLLTIGAIMAISIIVTQLLNTYFFQSISFGNKITELEGTGVEAFGRASEIIQGSIKSLEALALSPDLEEAVKIANLAYEGYTPAEIQAMIDELDQAWQNEDPSIQELINSIKQNSVSTRLRVFIENFPEEVEVFVTDMRGLNVAMTERTGDYWQADEGWWEGAYAAGFGKTYISKVEYDESSRTYAINVGVPIRDTDGEVIGILRGTIDVSIVFRDLSHINFGNTGSATLFDRDGTVLYSRDTAKLMTMMPDDFLPNLQGDTNHTEKGLQDLDGNDAVLAFFMPSDEILQQLGWVLVLDQDMSEINQQITSEVIPVYVIGGILILVSLVVFFFIVNAIIKPIQIMTGALQNLKVGNLNRDIPIEVKKQILARSDELGEMGEGLANTEQYMIEMVEIAARIADGDLTIKLEPRSDEDELGFALVKMIEKLREMIESVAESANDLNKSARTLSTASEQAGMAANQIGSTIQQVATGNQQQTESITSTAQQIDQLGRAIEGVAQGAQEQAMATTSASNLSTQISASVSLVADTAKTGVKTAQETANTAKKGSDTVERNLIAMDNIKQKVDLSSDKVRQMGDRSEEIRTILGTISDIASQTNMLALNAAIEAARAGEHGKGFAVVADEVRRLAEHSAEATDEISKLIEDIDTTVGEAVQAMFDSKEEVETGVSTANEAGTALNEILSASESVNHQVQAIYEASNEMQTFAQSLMNSMETVSAVTEENTAATEEMSASSTEVNKAIEDISSISEENAAAVEEVSASTEEMSAQVQEVAASAGDLSKMSETLASLVSQFKISEEDEEDVETGSADQSLIKKDEE